MSLIETETNWLLVLILALHVKPTEASSEGVVRILTVGVRGHSGFSAVDLLSGAPQELRESVQTPVITDDGRRMMLVTGPNLCEEDTSIQSFTTALFLSSPGPHAVLMLLNLEDHQSSQCDVLKRAQELLGEEVLRFCIVLLPQNQQERLTEASRSMIDACGGRFHMIKDSEPKDAQAKALVEEIDKLVWLNGDGFYSALETENIILPIIYNISVGLIGNFRWILLASLAIFTKRKDEIVNLKPKFALALFMVFLVHVLNPDVAIPINLALAASEATTMETNTFTKWKKEISHLLRSEPGLIALILFIAVLAPTLLITVSSLLLGSALVFGTMMSVRSWSDVLIACHAAPGVTVGVLAFMFHPEEFNCDPPAFAVGSFLFSIFGAMLSMGFVTVISLLGVKVAIMVMISVLTIAYFRVKSETLWVLICLTILTLLFSCTCVLIGSVHLILWQIMSFFYYLFNFAWHY